MDGKAKIKRSSTKTGIFVDGNIKDMRNLLILATITVFLSGCFQGREAELGADETLKTFYRGLCAGDFDGAAVLCDSLSMDGYINGFRDRWEKTSSKVCAMASDILSEMAVSVTDVGKNGHTRTIFYTLTATDGQSKEKVATLRKEEGEWKIETITDRD